MLEQHPARAPGGIPLERRALGAPQSREQQVPQPLEAPPEQIVLRGEVSVEGCPADIGLLENVLHGDLVVVLATNEGDERIVKRRAGPQHSSVDRHRCAHLPVPELQRRPDSIPDTDDAAVRELSNTMFRSSVV